MPFADSILVCMAGAFTALKFEERTYNGSRYFCHRLPHRCTLPPPSDHGGLVRAFSTASTSGRWRLFRKSGFDNMPSNTAFSILVSPLNNNKHRPLRNRQEACLAGDDGDRYEGLRVGGNLNLMDCRTPCRGSAARTAEMTFGSSDWMREPRQQRRGRRERIIGERYGFRRDYVLANRPKTWRRKGPLRKRSGDPHAGFAGLRAAARSCGVLYRAGLQRASVHLKGKVRDTFARETRK